MKILNDVTCEYTRTKVTTVGFKKYLLWGPRSVSHTTVQSGKMKINDVIIDMQGATPPSHKFEITHEDKILKGVFAYEEVSPGIWKCSVDAYDMKDPEKDGHIGLDRFDRHECCGDRGCPSNN